MPVANFPGVRGLAPVLATIALVTAACGRVTEPALIEYRDPQSGFVVRYPREWAKSTDAAGARVRFVPPAFSQTPTTAPEFILVMTMPSEGQLDEGGRRRIVFTQLPIQGVSEFQRDARTAGTAVWDRFEVTGATADVEWASLGLLVAGEGRYYLVVCAKPLAQWRTGQHQCEQVITAFRPGPFSR